MKLRCLSALALLGACFVPLQAQQQWDPGGTPATPSGGTGTWNSSNANWSNGTSDSTWAGGTATFGGTAGGVTVSGTVSASQINFTTSAYSLINGTISSPGNLTITGRSTGAFTTNISSLLAPAGTLRFEQDSTSTSNTRFEVVLVNGSNSQSSTEISLGTVLRTANGNTLGSGGLRVFAGSGTAATGTAYLTLTSSMTVSRSINLDFTGGSSNFRIDSGPTAPTAALTISGAISGTGNLLLSPGSNGGSITISGANTYTGTTGFAAAGTGRLVLGADNVLSNNTFTVAFGGGTFDLNNRTETVGALVLSSLSTNTTFDFGTGASALYFGDSSAATWSGAASINITNFVAGTDVLRFGTTSGGLTPTQLNRLTFGGTAAQIDANGYVTPVGTAIPEPAHAVLGAGVVGLLLALRRRAGRRA